MKTATLKEEQFITNGNGKRVGVLLDLKTYERLREAEEELADVRAYDSARPAVQAEVEGGRFVSLAKYHAIRTRKSK
ncbi:MAG: hypothetical protein HY298_16080 [Verrucomicrobia bacterium]|nr:hypothetical protein [Verrucomicrobiota bacterium]